MPTTVTHSIGTSSRDYSTLQAWEDACPADLTAVDQIWRGECYNDSEFLASSIQLTASSTTDSTRFLLLTTASGQGFKDNAGASTLPLKYDQSKGVGIRFNGGYDTIIDGGGHLKVDGLQIYYDSGSASNYSPALYRLVSLKNSILETRMTSGFVMRNVNEIVNTVIVVRGTSFSGSAIRTDSGTDRIINVTLVRPSDLTAGGTGIATDDGFPQVTNCVAFGFSTMFSGTIGSYAAGSGNNASSVASGSIPGSSNQASLTYSSQFQAVTDSARDWRPKSGGALNTNGSRQQSYTSDLDIIAAARSTSTPSIGAREFATAGGATNTKVMSDTMTLADAEIDILRLVRVPSDAITLIDQGLDVLRLKRIAEDTLALVDSFVKSVVTGGQVITTKVMSETIAMVDGLVEWLRRVRQASDTIIMTDGDRYKTTILTTDESVDLTDGTVRIQRLVRRVGDNMDVIDAFSKIIAGAGLTYIKVMSDNVTMIDDGGRRWTFRLSRLTDTIALNDALVRALARMRIMGEVIEYADGVLSIRRSVRSMDEAIVIVDDRVSTFYQDHLSSVEFRFGIEPTPFIFGGT